MTDGPANKPLQSYALPCPFILSSISATCMQEHALARQLLAPSLAFYDQAMRPGMHGETD